MSLGIRSAANIGVDQSGKGERLFKFSIVIAVVLIAIVITTLITYARSNITTPHIPLYPGARVFDWPANGEDLEGLRETFWAPSKNDTNSEFNYAEYRERIESAVLERVVMEVVGPPKEVSAKYFALLREDGWGEGGSCRSGLVESGISSLRRRGGWSEDVKWRATLEFRKAQDNIGAPPTPRT